MNFTARRFFKQKRYDKFNAARNETRGEQKHERREKRRPTFERGARLLDQAKMKPEHYTDIFEPFEKLVRIEIAGESFAVPENNTLLRCLQYLWMEAISYGDFCWNGDCANCRIWLADAAPEKPLLACRTKVYDRMKVARLSEEIKTILKAEQ